jgi:hypothetical protein
MQMSSIVVSPVLEGRSLSRSACGFVGIQAASKLRF